MTHISDSAQDGIRPVNLRTDLGALADLIEIAFADTMDSSGRAAVREMRALSQLGRLTSVIGASNDLVQGMGMGYVWLEHGKVIGNVSIYPATLPPGGAKWYGGAVYLIANVATHPDYRGRGIARQLMTTSMHAIRTRAHAGRSIALLQVEERNHVARQLYESLGFKNERVWNHWRRSSMTRISSAQPNPDVYITQRRASEWRSEYALAMRARPPEMGGIGWLRPTFAGMFAPSLMRMIRDFVNLRSIERLVIRDQAGDVRAALWAENALAASAINLTLMVDPDYTGLYDEAFITYAVRRFGMKGALSLEHPADEQVTNTLLSRYHFGIQRTFVNMRWDADTLP